MKRTRTALLGMTVAGLSMAAVLIAAEVVLRFLPVFDGLWTVPVNRAQPVMRFEPNRSFVWSRGWDFKGATSGRVNNAGFVNDQDYRQAGAEAVLAVVGDSYVEALMVPHEETLQGRLQGFVQEQGRVYSFAASGAPLSQYLAWVNHAREAYAPQGVVIVVVGNDFDESLMRYKSGPGFHHYVDQDGELVSTLVPYEPSWMRNIARRSTLVRYLVFHLEIQQAIGRLLSRLKDGLSVAVSGSVVHADDAADTAPEKPRYFGNAPASVPRERMEWSRRAVDAFFRDLPNASGLPAGQVLFVVDAFRQAIYDPTLLDDAHESLFGHMRAYLMEQAKARGYRVVDLQAPMDSAYRRSGLRMEFTFDYHWSGVGHGVAAEAIRESGFLEPLFGDGAPPPSRR